LSQTVSGSLEADTKRSGHLKIISNHKITIHPHSTPS
jgi:hypothetical protein